MKKKCPSCREMVSVKELFTSTPPIRCPSCRAELEWNRWILAAIGIVAGAFAFVWVDTIHYTIVSLVISLLLTLGLMSQEYLLSIQETQTAIVLHAVDYALTFVILMLVGIALFGRVKVSQRQAQKIF